MRSFLEEFDFLCNVFSTSCGFHYLFVKMNFHVFRSFKQIIIMIQDDTTSSSLFCLFYTANSFLKNLLRIITDSRRTPRSSDIAYVRYKVHR